MGSTIKLDTHGGCQAGEGWHDGTLRGQTLQGLLTEIYRKDKSHEESLSQHTTPDLCTNST